MSTELTKENTLLLNLRVINFFISTLAIVLLVWMAIGESVLSPLCELKIFANRRESCFRNGAIEMRDRASIVILAVLTFAFIVSMKFTYIKKMIIKQNFLTSSVDKFAFVIVIAAIASRDYYPSFADWSLNEFSGLGFDVAIVVIFVVIVTVYWPKSTSGEDLSQMNYETNLIFKNFIALLIFVLFYLPVILRLSPNIPLVDVTSYVFNELLAPVAGNFPSADSIPQYNSLLGFPILIISKLVGSEIAISIIPIWISILNLGVLATLTTIWLRLFPNTPKLFALLGVSSIILARSSDLSSALTLTSFMSWTVRTALPALAALLLHISLSSEKRETIYPWTLILGAVTSLAVVNNIEFGLTLTFAMICTIVAFSSYRKLPWKFFFNFILGMSAAILLLHLFYRINGKAINLRFLTLISREFGANGFGSWPMPIFGFFIVVYAIAGLTIMFSIRALNDLPSPLLTMGTQNLVADVGLAIFAGVWTLSSLVFYSGRSVDGNLRVVFLPTLIAILTTIKLIMPTPVKKIPRNISKSALLPVATILALPIALLINAPDPLLNWSRVITRGDSPTWSWTSIENKPLAKSYIELSKSGIGNIGIMGNDGNAIAIVTGAKNIMAVNSLADFIISDKIRKEVCHKLAVSGVKLVLVEGLYDNSENYPCDGMKNPKIQSEGSVTLFEYSVKKSD